MNCAKLLVRNQYSCAVLCRNNVPTFCNKSTWTNRPIERNINTSKFIPKKDLLLSVFNPGTDASPLPLRGFCTNQSLRMPVSAYTAAERGQSNTDQYKVFISDDCGPISPFHDIPLVANDNPKTFHVVIEIPRWTNAKMEIDTKSPLNPIVQDQKNEKLRYVKNSFPHHGYIWNYGALPQTWENPHHVDPNTGEQGDNDPVDICEIGGRVAKRGDVLEVKVIGILALVDDGETDWKILVIDVTDPLAEKLNNLDDIEREMPGFLDNTREWFRIYKMPDGKPENKFAFNGEFKDAQFAHQIIEETHLYWKQLVGLATPSVDGGSLETGCVAVEGAANVISRENAALIFNRTEEFSTGPTPDASLDKWYYNHLKISTLE